MSVVQFPARKSKPKDDQLAPMLRKVALNLVSIASLMKDQEISDHELIIVAAGLISAASYKIVESEK
jgi:hypothetical protein